MKKIAFFLGCNIPFNRPDIEYSVRFLLDALDVQVVELEGATCCPAFGTMASVDEESWAISSAWNLILAEEKGVDILTACGSCYASLNESKHHMAKKPHLKEHVNNIYQKVGKEYKGTVKVYNLINYLYDEVGLDYIKQKVKNNLNGLVCGVQPGCHNLWPSKALPKTDENIFRPKRIRELCEAIGGVAPFYTCLTDCCGMGALRSTAVEKSLALFKQKLDTMKEEINPDLTVSGCSSCLMQFDGGQAMILEKKYIRYQIPAFHLGQIVALALGAEPEKAMAFAKIPADNVISKIQGGV